MIPAALHTAASLSLIGRDASEMSVSPAQKVLNPPPVPLVRTVIRTPEFSFWKSPAASVMSGATVLEPSRRMVPVSPPAVAAGSLPHAVVTRQSEIRTRAANCRLQNLRHFTSGTIPVGSL